ncbi:MAG: DUF1552 domain-containing protein [Myxococcota bacterium]|nr:DUF1552 domain-containing protein [Myxococcota bacterium]
MKYKRRDILQTLGLSAMALPFLECFAPSVGRAAPATPKRLLIVVHRHGNIPNKWFPVDNQGDNFMLSEILIPIAQFRQRIAQIAGVDNNVLYHYMHSNIHALADTTLLTANIPQKELIYGKFYNQGPSIDQLIASRISTQTALPSLNLSIGSDEGGGVTNTHFLYDLEGFPVSSIADPQEAYRLLTGDSARSSGWRSTRTDGIVQNLSFLQNQLGQEDRHRLDAHIEKLYELERGFQQRTCSISEPSPYDFRHQDDESANIQIDLLADAFACDLTRVGTLIFDNLEETPLSWLQSNNNPIYNRNTYRSWEDLIHYGGEIEDPDLETGFLWYSEKFAQLLRTFDQRMDSDGDNLLDNTLIVWLSEFGDGWSHSIENLPILIAGASTAATGQFKDYRSNPYSTNDLYLSILRAFGQNDAQFGYDAPNIQMEAIPDLI